MEYAALVDLYDRLAATDSNNEKRDCLASAFADAGELLPRLVTLVRGRLSPAYDRTDLGVSSSLTLEAVLRATGAPEAAVRERWKETGDLGDATAWAATNGGQQALFSSTLTVDRVHDDLRELAGDEGSGSQDRKVETPAGLVADADAEEAGAVTAGFSGWAVDSSFRFQGDYDVTFPLSDHCDFEELQALVGAVGPERVYTQHGATDSLAAELTAAGYDATALRQHQTSLGDF